MRRGRGRRHNQLPGDDLVAIAVVRERADHGGSPAFSGVWHTHIVLGSARVAQVDTVKNAHSSIRNPYRIIATASAFTRGGVLPTGYYSACLLLSCNAKRYGDVSR